jgi:hypothetical protein
MTDSLSDEEIEEKMQLIYDRFAPSQEAIDLIKAIKKTEKECEEIIEYFRAKGINYGGEK